jgi:hypothetical protein
MLEYFGAWMATFVMGVVYEWLRSVRVSVEAHFAKLLIDTVKKLNAGKCGCSEKEFPRFAQLMILRMPSTLSFCDHAFYDYEIKLY